MKKITQIALLGSASVLVTGAGTAYAVSTAAAPPPVIHACRANANGAVRIVATSTRCRAGETRITWNQRGVAGPKGDRGPSNGNAYSGPDRAPMTAAQEQEVASLQLPAGSYILTGTVTFEYATYVECGFNDAWRTAITPQENSATADRYATLTVTIGRTLTQAGKVSVRCFSPANAVARRPALTAVRVGNLQSNGSPTAKTGHNSLK